MRYWWYFTYSPLSSCLQYFSPHSQFPAKNVDSYFIKKNRNIQTISTWCCYCANSHSLPMPICSAFPPVSTDWLFWSLFLSHLLKDIRLIFVSPSASSDFPSLLRLLHLLGSLLYYFPSLKNSPCLHITLCQLAHFSASLYSETLRKNYLHLLPSSHVHLNLLYSGFPSFLLVLPCYPHL